MLPTMSTYRRPAIKDNLSNEQENWGAPIKEEVRREREDNRLRSEHRRRNGVAWERSLTEAEPPKRRRDKKSEWPLGQKAPERCRERHALEKPTLAPSALKVYWPDKMRQGLVVSIWGLWMDG